MSTGKDNVTQNKRVYVGNLSWSVTWRDLKDHMRSAGEVLRADVLTGYDGRSKGCGIVEYATVEEANTAVETLNNSDLMGRQIFVREDREEKGAVGGGAAASGGGGGKSAGGQGGKRTRKLCYLLYSLLFRRLERLVAVGARTRATAVGKSVGVTEQLDVNGLH